MPVALDLAVKNLAAVRAAFTHIQVWWSATETGTFIEATTATTRIALTDRSTYLFVHPTRDESEWFAVRYFNERTGRLSPLGPPVQGRLDPSLDVLSVEELKTNYLFGINLTDEAGNEYPDSLFRWYIRAAVAALETYLGNVPVRERSITAERVDYFGRDFSKFQFFKTKFWPIVQIDEVRLVVPSQPTATRVFPADWIRVDEDAGHVEIFPGSGALSLPFFSAGGILLPTLFGTTGYLPRVLECDYIAGFRKGEIPYDLRHAVGMMAAGGPLNIAGDLIVGAGIAGFSLGLDGINQSVQTTSSATNSGYGARILQYAKELKTMLPRLYNYYNGIQAAAI